MSYSPPDPSSAVAWPRVAHLLRPAQGGMRSQVRALLTAVPAEQRLLAAPPDVLSSLTEILPGSEQGLELEASGNAPPALLKAGRAAGRWAKAQGAQLLHGHGLRWAPLFWTASLTSGLPLVVTLHNLMPDRLATTERGALQVALARARRVIAVSEAVAAGAHGLAPTERTVVVYNGVEVDRYPRTVEVRRATRAALGIPEEAPVALCVARLSAEKGVATFLEAAALVRERLPQAYFLVAGEGPQRARLEWHMRFLLQEGRTTVRLLGARDDVPNLLAAADLLCTPSREEGLGLAPIEAMAAGLPVVATRVGGLPEVIADGDTGLLVPSQRDPVALAEALVALLSDPLKAQAMGEAGRDRVRARFSAEGMLAGTRRVYLQALAGRD